MAMNKPTMRDLPNTPAPDNVNSLSQYVDSLPEKRGFFEGASLDPTIPQDQPLLQQFVDATVQGLLGDSQVQKLMDRNPRAAGVLAKALTTQKLYKEKTSGIQNVLQSNLQEDNLPPDQSGPTRPTSFNYPAAIAKLNAMGETERAGLLAKQYEQLATAQNKGMNAYGGIQYSVDASGNFVPYVVNEQTLNTTAIKPPAGTKATIPITPTPGVGPGGPGFYAIPGRASVNGPTQIPGVTPLPTQEEAAKSATAETAFDMGNRLKQYVDNNDISVGPVSGRLLRAKAARSRCIIDRTESQ
jgi:hypothetical protein